MEEQRNYKVYAHIRKEPDENGVYKRYIGITGKPTLKDRWCTNGKGYKYKNKNNTYTHFYKAILKYGWAGFTHILLLQNLTRKEALDWEVKLIEIYKSSDEYYGYNGTKGGEHNIPNETSRKRNSESKKGSKNPMYGKCGCLNPAYGRRGELNPLYKIPRTDEVKRKISIANSGKNNGMYGKTPWNKGTKGLTKANSGSFKKGMKPKNIIMVVRLLDNKIYESIQQCMLDNKVSREKINKHCNNLVFSSEYMYYKDWVKLGLDK